MVDAIQGLGAFPIDVQAAHIDALAADGHKWLVGPEGCGILYISRRLQEQVEPVEFGWTNVSSYNDYASRDMTLRPDAGRYECGTLNTIGCFGLRAALDFLLEIGIDSIAPAVRGLADQISEGVRRRGYEVLGEPNAGIGLTPASSASASPGSTAPPSAPACAKSPSPPPRVRAGCAPRCTSTSRRRKLGRCWICCRKTRVWAMRRL